VSRPCGVGLHTLLAQARADLVSKHEVLRSLGLNPPIELPLDLPLLAAWGCSKRCKARSQRLLLRQLLWLLLLLWLLEPGTESCCAAQLHRD